MSEPDHPKTDEAMTDFVKTLGTPTSHKDWSVSDMIAEALDAQEQERTGVILPAFMHGMLAGLKIAGK